MCSDLEGGTYNTQPRFKPLPKSNLSPKVRLDQVKVNQPNGTIWTLPILAQASIQDCSSGLYCLTGLSHGPRVNQIVTPDPSLSLSISLISIVCVCTLVICVRLSRFGVHIKKNVTSIYK